MLRASLCAVGAICALTTVAQAQTFEECNGIIVIEVESSPPAGDWVAETTHPNYAGNSYYRWNGPNLFSSPGSGVLNYSIKPATTGDYLIKLRNWNPGSDTTEENDVFIRVENQTSWIKAYSGSPGNQWKWNHNFDPGHTPVKYSFQANQTYNLQISGRSTNYAIDRIHIYKNSHPDATNINLAQTVSCGGPPVDAGVPPDVGVPVDSGGPPGPTVTSLTLINANTDQPIAAHDPLSTSAQISFQDLPTTNLNFRANVSGPVGSVVFGLPGGASNTESAAPYAAGGDASGNYNPMSINPGPYTITATPYTGANGSGSAGPTLTLNLTFYTGPVPDAGVADAAISRDSGGRSDAAAPAGDGGRVSDSGSPRSDATVGGDGGGSSDGCAVAAGSPDAVLLLLLAAVLGSRRRKRQR